MIETRLMETQMTEMFGIQSDVEMAMELKYEGYGHGNVLSVENAYTRWSKTNIWGHL